jgi:hypothetical protein
VFATSASPHVTEKLNWEHLLVYFVGDKKLGGKMFAITDMDDASRIDR